MQIEPGIAIRKFTELDRAVVRRISCETALMGEPGSAFFTDDEIFADALTLYFTDFEPEACLVAEIDQIVIGYLLGAKDIKVMDKVFGRKIALNLFLKALSRKVFLKNKNIIFFWNLFISLIKGEFLAPGFSREYPATLHINILKEYRGRGIGAKLIDTYLQYLRKERVAGVHFATLSEKGGNFFTQQGFDQLFRGKRSYFWYFLYRDTPFYIYGKKLR